MDPRLAGPYIWALLRTMSQIGGSVGAKQEFHDMIAVMNTPTETHVVASSSSSTHNVKPASKRKDGISRGGGTETATASTTDEASGECVSCARGSNNGRGRVCYTCRIDNLAVINHARRLENMKPVKLGCDRFKLQQCNNHADNPTRHTCQFCYQDALPRTMWPFSTMPGGDDENSNEGPEYRAVTPDDEITVAVHSSNVEELLDCIFESLTSLFPCTHCRKHFSLLYHSWWNTKDVELGLAKYFRSLDTLSPHGTHPKTPRPRSYNNAPKDGLQFVWLAECTVNATLHARIDHQLFVTNLHTIMNQGSYLQPAEVWIAVYCLVMLNKSVIMSPEEVRQKLQTGEITEAISTPLDAAQYDDDESPPPLKPRTRDEVSDEEVRRVRVDMMLETQSAELGRAARYFKKALDRGEEVIDDYLDRCGFSKMAVPSSSSSAAETEQRDEEEEAPVPEPTEQWTQDETRSFLIDGLASSFYLAYTERDDDMRPAATANMNAIIFKESDVSRKLAAAQLLHALAQMFQYTDGKLNSLSAFLAPVPHMTLMSMNPLTLPIWIAVNEWRWHERHGDCRGLIDGMDQVFKCIPSIQVPYWEKIRDAFRAKNPTRAFTMNPQSLRQAGPVRLAFQSKRHHRGGGTAKKNPVAPVYEADEELYASIKPDEVMPSEWVETFALARVQYMRNTLN